MKKVFILCLILCVFCFWGGFFPTFAQKKNVENSIGMEFVLIPAGSFMMGCDENSEDCNDDETPQHWVTISNSFYMGKYEVTQAEWEAVMGNNPSEYKGGTRPVENVSWDDVEEFIRRLNQKEGTSKYRLPTEAEWEYAARAGSTTAYCFGDDARQLEKYAWYDGGSGTHPVGQLRANKWGLYDMHGNVWEWVQDWNGNYSVSSQTDPKGPTSGDYRVLRGGGWDGRAQGCRSAYRNDDTPDHRNIDYGFRLVFSPDQ